MLYLADTYVVFDDVNYISRGWINRNKFWIGGREQLLSMPLQSASPNKKIRDIKIDCLDYWFPKFQNSLRHAYRKCPYYNDVSVLIESIFEPNSGNLLEFLENSLNRTLAYLGVSCSLCRSSDFPKAKDCNGQDRIISICSQMKTTTYINLPGGRQLYDPEAFLEMGLKLRFIDTRWDSLDLRHSLSNGLPMLSIIDLLMWNSPKAVRTALGQCELIEN
jgi:hypothetical protein